jgi:glycosyltransferase involved in cell wall biosynthesis
VNSARSENKQKIGTRLIASARSRSRRKLANVIAGPLTSISRKRALAASKQPGVTIVTVSFNTLGCLRAFVAGVRRHSPPGTPMIVVDNASSDGCAKWARQQPDVKVLRLPINIMHGPAMNLGLALCRTEHFVALDVDAFPIDDNWLDHLLIPLSSDDDAAHVSGAGYPPTPQPEIQPYVHACCLAMKTERFLSRGHTFSPGATWDTAQAISQREWPRIHTIPITSSRGPGILGSVFGGIVYHNFYSARFQTTSLAKIDWVDRGQPESAWAEAMAIYFPDGVDSEGPNG